MLLKRNFFQSSSPHKLATYSKESVKESDRAVILIHGYAEYTDRYRSFIDRLTKEGFHVFGIDHMGHGRSEGKRGYIPNIQLVLNDVSEWFESLQQQFPGYNWFVFGHSMGGGIALDLVLNHQDSVKALVLSGALIQLPKLVPVWMEAIGRLLALVAPTLPVVPVDFDHISRDPDVVRIYREDPLVYSDKVRARTAIQVEKLTRLLQPRLHELAVPVWIGHGSLDRITDPEGSKLLHQKAASTDKTLKIYHGLFHEILNEPEAQVVIHDMCHWLSKR